MLVIYLIFCIATAISAKMYLFNPVLEMVALVDGEENNLVKYKNTTAFVIFCFSLLTAPLLFVIYLSRDLSSKFSEALTEALLND